MRFWTHLSYPMEGFFDILKKMAFGNFSNESSVQINSVVHEQIQNYLPLMLIIMCVIYTLEILKIVISVFRSRVIKN